VVSVPMMSDMFFVDFDRRANFHGLRFSHGWKKVESEREQNNYEQFFHRILTLYPRYNFNVNLNLTNEEQSFEEN
jgi:hypothetical protein